MSTQSRPSRLPVCVGALAAVIVLTWADQYTKMLAVEHLKGRDSLVLLQGVLELRYLENLGAAFGVLQNNRTFFIAVACIAILAMAVLYVRLPLTRSASGRSYFPLRVCIVLLASGALGNLIDRIQLVYVRDFIYFSLIDFPIFNVADIYVTVSVALMVLLIFLYYKEEDLSFSMKTGVQND